MMTRKIIRRFDRSRKKYSTLMVAYGANTNFESMALRCPESVYLGNVAIEDYRLVFRTVADVIEAKGCTLYAALWAVTEKDERSLDRFEGVPTLYVKRYFDIKFPDGKTRRALCYMMRGPRNDRMEPPVSYENTLRSGYTACGLPLGQIDVAIADAASSHRRAVVTKTRWTPKEILPTAETTADDDFQLTPDQE